MKKIWPTSIQSISKMHLVATDGGSVRNGRANCRCAYGVFFGDSDRRNESGEITEKPSNQTAELTAIARAISIIATDDKRYTILTDSDYSIKCITQWAPSWMRNGWKKRDGKPVHHRYILENAVNQYTQIKDRVTFKHIRSHKKPPTDQQSQAYTEWYMNDRADKMCTDILKMRGGSGGTSGEPK